MLFTKRSVTPIYKPNDEINIHGVKEQQTLEAVVNRPPPAVGGDCSLNCEADSRDEVRWRIDPALVTAA